MGTYKLGNNYKLYVESSTPGTFYPIAGQGNFSKSGSAANIDTTTKDDYPWGTTAPGTRSLTMTLAITPNLPDANGYSRLETLANANPPAAFNIQLRKSPFSGGDVVFAAPVYALGIDQQFPQNDKVTSSVNFGLAGAPTVDTLA